MNQLDDQQVEQLIESVRHLHHADLLSLGTMCLGLFAESVSPLPDREDAKLTLRVIRKFLADLDAIARP